MASPAVDARAVISALATAPCRGDGKETGVTYRVWVRSWVARDEVFEDRESAEMFRLKLAASRPRLDPSDVAIVVERTADSPPAREATA